MGTNWKEIGPTIILNKLKDDLYRNFTQTILLINKKYFNNNAGPKSMDDFENNFSKIYSDSIYSSVVHLFASKISENSMSPIYQYLYTHAGSLSMAEITHLTFWQILSKFFGRFIGLDLYPSSNKYASHADDQLLIFNTNSLPFDGAFTDEDKTVSRNLLTLWTDFVKTGKQPCSLSCWTPLNKDNQQRLEIGTNGLNMI